MDPLHTELLLADTTALQTDLLLSQRLQAVLDGATNVSIIAADLAGIITVFNSGAERMLGYTSEEMVGNKTPALFHLQSEVVARGLELTRETGRSVQGFDVFVERARNEQPEEREWTYVRKDGQHLTVNLVVTVLKDAIGTTNGFLGVALDVSARKKAEAASRASDEYLRLIVDATEDYALITLDTRGYVTSWNLGAERLKGYKSDEILGQHFSRFYLPEDIERQHPVEELRIAATKGRHTEEGWRVRKDGSAFLADVLITAIYDDTGDVRGFAKVVHDISERKRVEKRFQLLVEAAPNGMLIASADGTITLVNTEIEKLFGFERSELVGQRVEMLLPQQLRLNHVGYRSEFAAAPRARVMGANRDLFGLHKNGKQVPVEVRLTAIDTSDGQSVLASVTDITARKKVEKMLADQALILDLANDTIFIRDAENRITYWNQGAERLYGWSKVEAVGQVTHLLFKTKFPQPLDDIEAKLLSLGHWSGELEHTRRDGSVVVVASTWTLQRGDSDVAVSTLEMNYDITARKHAENQVSERNTQLEMAYKDLEKSRNELERRVQERTEELATANDVLGRSNLELQQFAYIASHDLQSPLRSISGFVQLLRTEYEGKLDEQADDWIRRTVQSTEKMQALIRDLLSYSRVDSRSRPFEATPLHDVFTDAVSMLESSIQDSSGQVTCGELPVVMGDRAQLVQLMQNLIGNGLKYHGQTLPVVHVSAEHIGKEWLFSVQDNGIGIAPQYHAQIFEIFKRLHDQKEYPGTGIGLAVCSRVVNRHGGRIWVKPESGSGTTFQFTIPEGILTQ